MPTFVFFQNGVPTGVTVEGIKGHRSVVLTADGLVDRVRGADRVALEEIVETLAEKEKGAGRE